MIDHIWSVLCQRSVIDKDSNTMTLFDAIEQLTISGAELPAIAPIPMELVSLWSRTEPDRQARGRARVCLIEPDNSIQQPSFEIDIDLTAHERYRTRGRMGGMPIRAAGRYKFRVELQIEGDHQWREVARIPVQVVIEPAGG